MNAKKLTVLISVVSILVGGLTTFAVHEYYQVDEKYAKGFEEGMDVMNARYMTEIREAQGKGGSWFEVCDRHHHCEHLTVSYEESYAP